MPIYINKNGQQSGPFEDSVVIDQLRSGSLSPNDMAIRQGDASWQRVGDMFPGVSAGPSSSSASPLGATVTAPVESVAPAAKKGGGCLKGGLIGTGLILLLLGIAVAAGSRFIPSTSCELAKADEERIDKLERDIEKAKSNFDYDEIGPKAIELDEATAGYEVSKKYCDDDKFRNDIIGIAGAVIAVLGVLMAVVGFFVGRGK
jgi:hypothetical protein